MLSTPRTNRLMPGFGLSMGYTLLYLSLLLILPLGGLVLHASSLSLPAFAALILDARVIAAFRLSFSASFLAGLINTFFGLLVAWVLVRYRFPGRRVVDAIVDLPFALPTAVAGISLTTILSPNGSIGRYLALFGIEGSFSPFGIVVALVFIGLPFVVRTVQPVLEDLNLEVEEAAHSLGADRLQAFRRVILPALAPSLLTGFTLSFARALGEYGSVVFISGNMPYRTEIVPLLIMTRLEQYDYAGATALAVAMLLCSFILLLFVNLLQRRTGRAAIR